MDLLRFQRNEITEYEVYRRISSLVKGSNKDTLESIAEDELKHYEILRKLTGNEVRPSKLRVLMYLILYRIFGITFTVKLMERAEDSAQRGYESLAESYEEIKEILNEEFEHERKLADMIREERVEYIGSIVLGINDALVELTGSLAGFSMALLNSKYVAVAGLITGIAASLSMSASEYLSRKSELRGSPVKGALYTGAAYMTSVLLLVAPFLILEDVSMALMAMITLASIIICVFSSYLAVIREVSVVRSVLEMLLVGLGVAGVSYLIGAGAKLLLNLEAI
ncbi:MAG: VIT1/CCC1 family protein [Candidatus Korarchaeum sp.]